MSSKVLSSSDQKQVPAMSKTTKLTIKLNCGYGNSLTIRGEGAGLSWAKGITLKNIKADEWVFETDTKFTKCEFKILLNDEIYEAGPNRILVCGTSSHYTPKF